jgi:hypothetical protein
MITLIGWLGFSLAVALFASVRRNRNGIGWFFVAVVLSPLIAFVLLIILLPLEPDMHDPYTIEHRRSEGFSDHVMTGLLVLAIFLLILGGITIARAQQQLPPQQVFRNELGKTTGTATRSGNQTTYRDSFGNTIGTGTVDSSGTMIFRDSRGRTLESINNYGRNSSGQR